MLHLKKNSVCNQCRRVFCCADCRHKHEIKNHAIVVHRCANTSHDGGAGSEEPIYLFCPICEARPLLLKSMMYDEMLSHIEEKHLPLYCRKCAKIFREIADLTDFTKCCLTNAGAIDVAPTSAATVKNSEELQRQVSSAQTQTSPTQQSVADSSDGAQVTEVAHVTPLSVINMHWKAKSKVTHEEFISDSVSSFKNISSIHNSASMPRSVCATAPTGKGKLVRSTSTPLHTNLLPPKAKEQPTFNATGGQVSSISHSGCDMEPSPGVAPPYPSPLRQHQIDVNRWRRAGNRGRMPPVTPLRQLMSKTIQKAMAVHGQTTGGPGSPLDLRLSPALRRNSGGASEAPEKSRAPPFRRSILLSSQKLTESIVITTHRTAKIPCPVVKDSAPEFGGEASSSTGSVYKSCHSVEIITATEVSEVREGVDRLDVLHSGYTLAPTPISRLPGAAINKKFIQFETPTIEIETKIEPEAVAPPVRERETQSMESDASSFSTDVFFTPRSSPAPKSPGRERLPKDVLPVNLNRQFSDLRRPSLRDYARVHGSSQVQEVDDDEVFLPETKNKPSPTKSPGGGSLWSLMSSVMRFSSMRGAVSKPAEVAQEGTAKYIMKRCASIAGSLVRPKPTLNEEQLNSLKRKRTYSTSSYLPFRKSSDEGRRQATSTDADVGMSSKRFRIQGRRPIERMRLNP